MANIHPVYLEALDKSFILLSKDYTFQTDTMKKFLYKSFHNSPLFNNSIRKITRHIKDIITSICDIYYDLDEEDIFDIVSIVQNQFICTISEHNESNLTTTKSYQNPDAVSPGPDTVTQPPPYSTTVNDIIITNLKNNIIHLVTQMCEYHKNNDTIAVNKATRYINQHVQLLNSL